MTSHKAQSDTHDFSEKIQSMGALGDGAFGKQFSAIDREIDNAVKDRLKKGDYVAPPDQPSLAIAADRAVDSAVNSPVEGTGKDAVKSSGAHGNDLFDELLAMRGRGPTSYDEGIALYGGGLDSYIRLARTATRDIDSKEREIGRKHWAALSPSERKAIETEQAGRGEHFRWAIYSTNDNPPATPHLNAFTKGVEAAIAPLERERQAKLHKVWHDLPVESKALIYRSQEERKHITFS